MPLRAAQQMVAYLAAGRAALGALPRKDLLVAERFFDEGGGMQLVIHAPLGGRINRAWGLALRKKFCVSFDFELQAAATDDGIVISLGQPHSFPLDSVFGFVASNQARETLVQALLDRPMFEIRWRWNVTRSLVVLRRRNGKKIAPQILKMRVADTLSVVFPQAVACGENITGPREVPDHPLVFETIRDCLVEAMDVEGLTDLCGKLERGEIQILARDTVEPSPLCHELINANPYAFLDDAPLEERRTRAVTLRRGLPVDNTEAPTALDDAAILAAAEEVAPTVRDVDELHDALLALWLVPESMELGHLDWMQALVDTGRAVRVRWMLATAGSAPEPGEDVVRCAWVATERLGAARVILGEHLECTPNLATPAWSTIPDREAAIIKLVGAHLDHRGPVTAAALADELGLVTSDVLAALLWLEGDGAILRGSFTSGRPLTSTTVRAALAANDELDGVEWCNRRVLARIHRLTLARLRKEIEPVSAAALMRFMLRWQRVARNTQVIGNDGLVRVIEQLQGFETAAGAWERELLPARLHGYDASWLDQLCLAGHVVWCRLSPRKLDKEAEASEVEELVDPRGKRGGRSVDRAAVSRAVARTLGPDVQHVADDLDSIPAPALALGSEPTSTKPAKQSRLAPSRSAPLALMLRHNAAWLRAASSQQIDDSTLSEAAVRVRHHLATAGASFLADLVGDLPPDEVEEALWELVAAGLATADGFASLRVLVDRKRGEMKSLFDRRAFDAMPPARKWQEAIKRARTRDRERPGHALRSLPTAAGRWSLLPASGALGPQEAEAWARQLLHRYGVVFRDLIGRESGLPPWRDILVALRRLEARGEIRGGRFVNGFVGEQFALPEALDELRAVRNPGSVADVSRVAATDPLNLVGILSPGPRVPAVVGNAVLYVDGRCVASLEGGELVRREVPPQGARIDDDLTYHPPPRPIVVVQHQAALPL